ncbi:helix-turn-helix domain-containing protein [Maribius pontilimi]|uniref:Helix-turn-helix domain-containing protein n=1 Tax=Palleronia pontilimi TaxID=1964209 RepID=A0A934MDP1_9RHOB|nr:helix-turn-helix domain-containing protein [Palleronia pontilimi]MBJ3763695.1 helix-turn-helix domain-containing protein [Palleronia pontilimi]
MYVTLPTEPAFPAASLPMRGSPKRRAAFQRTLRCAEGHTLFYEGDEAEMIYQIKSGVVRLTRVLENGRRQVISFGLPGDFVGFPDGDRHHSDCEIIAPAEFIAHSRRALESGEGNVETHRRLLHAALQEISAMQDHFMMLARKSAMEKVASFLLVLSQRTGIGFGAQLAVSLPMSRADIADFLGLTIETVSRCFSQLRKDGVIVLDTPQSVRVRDAAALRRAALSTE